MFSPVFQLPFAGSLKETDRGLTMSDEEALLQAIYADPDNDLPRLVYADWLDEHDRGERAEFIRIQIEMENTEDRQFREQRCNFKKSDDPRFNKLKIREEVLLKAHKADWLGGRSALEANWKFRRGLLEHLMPHDNLHISFVDRLLSSPFLLEVRYLHARIVNYSLSALTKFAAGSHSRNLTLLSLGGGPIENSHIEAIAQSSVLTRLTTLDLDGDGRIDMRGLQMLISSSVLSNLTGLHLYRQPINPSGAEMLASSNNINKWLHLSLAEARLGNDGLRRLIGKNRFPHLETLSLRSNAIDDLGAIALAECDNFPRLSFLDLEDNGITERGARAVCNSFETTQIFLKGNPITPNSRRRLKKKYDVDFG